MAFLLMWFTKYISFMHCIFICSSNIINCNSYDLCLYIFFKNIENMLDFWCTIHRVTRCHLFLGNPSFSIVVSESKHPRFCPQRTILSPEVYFCCKNILPVNDKYAALTVWINLDFWTVSPIHITYGHPNYTYKV